MSLLVVLHEAALGIRCDITAGATVTAAAPTFATTLACTIAPTVTVTAALTGPQAITCAIAPTVTVTAGVTRAQPILCDITAGATVTVTNGFAHAITCDITAGATVTSLFVVPRAITAAITATATVVLAHPSNPTLVVAIAPVGATVTLAAPSFGIRSAIFAQAVVRLAGAAATPASRKGRLVTPEQMLSFTASGLAVVGRPAANVALWWKPQRGWIGQSATDRLILDFGSAKAPIGIALLETTLASASIKASSVADFSSNVTPLVEGGALAADGFVAPRQHGWLVLTGVSAQYLAIDPVSLVPGATAAAIGSVICWAVATELDGAIHPRIVTPRHAAVRVASASADDVVVTAPIAAELPLDGTAWLTAEMLPIVLDLATRGAADAVLYLRDPARPEQVYLVQRAAAPSITERLGTTGAPIVMREVA